MISQKDYYSEQLSSLQGPRLNAPPIKKRLIKACHSYLSDKIKASPAISKYIKVQFHLKAIVDKTKYDEEKFYTLKKDLSLFLELIFPNKFNQPYIYGTRICLFPGTFDPVTLGHINIIDRTLPLFDKLILVLGEMLNKVPMLAKNSGYSGLKKFTRAI